MKGEIRSIKTVYSGGAYGNPDKYGEYIYGLRPDGKTVRCKNKMTESGGIIIWSIYDDPEDDTICYHCETEFSPEEWVFISRKKAIQQPFICNQILDKRKDKRGQL